MCTLCLEVISGRLRPYEARLAYVELKHVIPEEHRKDLLGVIEFAEDSDSLEDGIIDTEELL